MNAADEAVLLEQPAVFAVELLEGVVGQDGGVDLFGDPQHERVSSADRSGRRGRQLTVGVGLLELSTLGLFDPMTERGVHHDRHLDPRVLLEKGHHGFVELLQTRS